MNALRSRRSRLAILLLTLLLPVSVEATSYRELSLVEMLARTEIAFLGSVSSVSVEERLGEPWTVVEFAIDRRLDGPTRNGRIELAFLGGDLASGGLQVALMPTFEVGEQVLLLAYDEPYISPIVGFNQGLWYQGDDGLRDIRGRRLSLDDEGRLTADGVGVDNDLLVDALERELEGRE